MHESSLQPQRPGPARAGGRNRVLHLNWMSRPSSVLDSVRVRAIATSKLLVVFAIHSLGSVGLLSNRSVALGGWWNPPTVAGCVTG